MLLQNFSLYGHFNPSLTHSIECNKQNNSRNLSAFGTNVFESQKSELCRYVYRRSRAVFTRDNNKKRTIQMTEEKVTLSLQYTVASFVTNSGANIGWSGRKQRLLISQEATRYWGGSVFQNLENLQTNPASQNIMRTLIQLTLATVRELLSILNSKELGIRFVHIQREIILSQNVLVTSSVDTF